MLVTCGIYLYSTRAKKFLVCHATNSPWNTWSIPKGLKEEGEDAFTAAARELYEETGVELKKLRVLKKHTLPPVNYRKQKKILESFLIITDAELENCNFICISHTEKSIPEVDRWKWIAPDMITSLLHESQAANYELIKELITKSA
jgi:8-oxo-dGTP pyrophosphatase MutT (NUDIX family)